MFERDEDVGMETSKANTASSTRGKFICSCERVTVRWVLKDGKRDLAGIGFCQGSFCMPKVVQIISKKSSVSFGREKLRQSVWMVEGRLRMICLVA